MAITIKQIAEICGVSRGTVDRVLNNRGNVKPETEKLVKQIVEQLGYTPNIAGKALAARKKNLVIGVILISEGNTFFNDVINGMKRAENEICDYGIKILIRTIKGYDMAQQIQAMEELKNDVNFLIFNPMNSKDVASKINELVDFGIQVMTINTDVENSRRMCYVGCDYYKSGQTACGMLGFLTGGIAKIGIVTGSVKISGHNERIAGFKDVYEKKYPDFKILEMVESNDDEIQGFEAAKGMLGRHPDMDTIYIVAAGSYGVCRAVLSSNMEDKVRIISYDDTPTTRAMMDIGLIKATICQQPFTQGYKAIQIAFRYLISGITPEREKHFVKNEIKILENL